MGLNDKLLHAAVDHSVDLAQYGTGVVHRMIAILNRTDSQLMFALADALERMGPDAFTVQRLDAMLSSVRLLNASAYQAVYKELNEEMQNLAEFEALYQQDLFRSILPVQVSVAAITAPIVYAAAVAEPFQGRLLSEWFGTMSDQRQMRLRDAVVMGFTQGETISQIVTRIRGTRAANYADGILEMDRRHASAVARTAVSHVSGYVRDHFYETNRELISAKVWVSTLDLRTTPACQVRDNKKYTIANKPIGHALPWLGGPGRLHWNCRSTSTIVIKSWEQLGLKASDLPDQMRASMDGQVPKDITYQEWLSGQSATRQNEVLGVTRANLVREGKLALPKFWDDNGNYLTLAELRTRHAKAFK